jgi:hypothetical protein
LKCAARISAEETNGITFAGGLGERLRANASALCESGETKEKKKERFHAPK